MIAKVFKVIWFVSLLVMMGVLLYCYASWPQSVLLSKVESDMNIDKSWLFYGTLSLLALLNVFTFIFPRIGSADSFMAWFFGVLTCLHIFLVSGMIFITVFNSSERYDFARLGPMLYTSIGLLVSWIIAWPVYQLLTKFSAKS
jgi:hypothetical protein